MLSNVNVLNYNKFHLIQRDLRWDAKTVKIQTPNYKWSADIYSLQARPVSSNVLKQIWAAKERCSVGELGEVEDQSGCSTLN